MKDFEEMDKVEQKITMEIHGSEAAYHEAYDKTLQNITGLTRLL
jgi:hypothetical protein